MEAQVKNVNGMWLNQINKYLPVPLKYKVWMSKKELACFDLYIRNSRNYLEFGCGGSTIRAIVKSHCQVVSVESSAEWIKELREYTLINRAERRDRLKFIEINIGPVGERGFPTDGNFRPEFPIFIKSF